MSVNPEEFYQRQKQAQQRHDQADAKFGTHSTVETWQLEQQDAAHGTFVPDPMDKEAAAKKPNLFVRIRKAIFKK